MNKNIDYTPGNYEGGNVVTITNPDTRLYVDLKWFKINELAVIPSYANDGDSGLDVCLPEDTREFVLEPGQRMLCKTGLKASFPSWLEMQVRSKSGRALKQGLVVLNSPGTIEHTYRGEIGVILHNSSTESITIKGGPNFPIAQLVLAPVVNTKHYNVAGTVCKSEDELFAGLESSRSGGFGSTYDIKEEKEKPVSNMVLITRYKGNKVVEVMVPNNFDEIAENVVRAMALNKEVNELKTEFSGTHEDFIDSLQDKFDLVNLDSDIATDIMRKFYVAVGYTPNVQDGVYSYAVPTSFVCELIKDATKLANKEVVIVPIFKDGKVVELLLPRDPEMFTNDVTGMNEKIKNLVLKIEEEQKYDVDSTKSEILFIFDSSNAADLNLSTKVISEFMKSTLPVDEIKDGVHVVIMKCTDIAKMFRDSITNRYSVANNVMNDSDKYMMNITEELSKEEESFKEAHEPINIFLFKVVDGVNIAKLYISKESEDNCTFEGGIINLCKAVNKTITASDHPEGVAGRIDLDKIIKEEFKIIDEASVSNKESLDTLKNQILMIKNLGISNKPNGYHTVLVSKSEIDKLGLK